MGFSSSSIVVLLLLLLIQSRANQEVKDIKLEYPAVDLNPSPLPGQSKDVFLCDRVQVRGISRLKLGKFVKSFRVTVAPSVVIPERLHTKILVCFHRKNSLGLCQCEKDEWKAIQKGLWSSYMSPYEDRYVDVKFIDAVPGPVTVALDEYSQQWRLVFLALGFVLLLLAPIVSSWVPFYYTSSMAIGVFLVIIIILFQGMKLLPTGRKNFLYLTIYGSVLGAGSFLLHHFSALINSVLHHFGMSEEMYNPVAVFLLVGIVLSGAALGFWIVRKFVISKDGSVDVGVAQFVKWAMRIIGSTSIFQCTPDTPLALGTLICCWILCSLITSLKFGSMRCQTYGFRNILLRKNNRAIEKRTNRAEFLSRSSPLGRRMLKSSNSRLTWSDSPVEVNAGVGVNTPSLGVQNQQEEYYSTFHKSRNRKKFTKKEWDDFTKDSTRQALTEWAATPEFTDWIIDRADRIQIIPSDSSDEAMASESDSTDEKEVGSGSRFQLFNWRNT